MKSNKFHFRLGRYRQVSLYIEMGCYWPDATPRGMHFTKNMEIHGIR